MSSPHQQANCFELTTAYLVNGGSFKFQYLESARMTARVFFKGKAKIHAVLAVKTPNGFVLTNPLVVLEEVRDES